MTVVFLLSEEAEKFGPLMKETVPYYMDKFKNIVTENNGYFVNGKVVLIIYLVWSIMYIY